MRPDGLALTGTAGIVVDGAVRDTALIGEIGFPVWATVITGGETQKGVGAGAVNIPISCAGVVVNPGALIGADDDGVLIVPREVADGRPAVDEAHRVRTRKLERFSKPGSAPIIDNYADLLKSYDMQEHEGAWDDR